MKWLNFEYGVVGGADIRFENLPTTAPSENGRVWNNNGILYIVIYTVVFAVIAQNIS